MDALISKGYDYWALGHVHQREILSENPMIVFPGNIQGRHIRESGDKGCMLVTVEDSVNAEFRSLDVIRWETIRVHSDADIYELSNLISEQFQALSDQHGNMPLAVRIEVHGASYPADPENWQNEIRALAVASGGRIWVEKIVFRPVLAESKPTIVSDKGPMGEILQIFQEYQTNPAKLNAAAESLNDLFVKLPAELRQGPDAAFSTDSDWLKQMLREAEPMLLARLKSEAK
jgi:DNA repair exonuclease SbcCD nuclease subunit